MPAFERAFARSLRRSFSDVFDLYAYRDQSGSRPTVQFEPWPGRSHLLVADTDSNNRREPYARIPEHIITPAAGLGDESRHPFAPDILAALPLADRAGAKHRRG